MHTITACSGDEDVPDNPNLKKTDYALYHNDTQALEGTNLNQLAWESDNEFVATVKDNTVIGHYVGKAIVKSNMYYSLSVEVKSKYNTYEEPYIGWGASKAMIKARYGTPESENENSLAYTTSNTNAPIMIFAFEDDKMSSCGVVCKTSIADELGDFLTERYVPINVDTDKYTATLLHCYGKISDPQADYGIAMQYSYSIGGILVAYTKVNSAESRHANSIDFDKALKTLENILN